MINDIQWALNELVQFVEASEYIEDKSPDAFFGSSPRDREKAVELLPIIEMILDEVNGSMGPQFSKRLTGGSGDVTHLTVARNQAMQAIVLLQRKEEIEEKLSDKSPTLRASHLHPWIWEASKSRWATLHYADAVNEAGRRVKDELEKRANRHLGETEQQLFNEVFGSKSTATWPDLSIEKYQEQRRRAIRGLAEGFYAGLRNGISHKSGQELTENEALEWLAVLSRIAYWVESASL